MNSAAFGFLSRSHIELSGKDRAQLLHGLCTNDIKRLTAGHGCETFLTNVQGKTIGFADVFCSPDSLFLESAAGEAPSIIAALDRYVIREQVQFIDRSPHWSALLVAGSEAEKLLADTLGIVPPNADLEHLVVEFQGTTVSVRKTRYVVPVCFHVAGPGAAIVTLADTMRSRGGTEWSPSQIESRRIQSGTPVFRIDVTSDNLPQEVDRNAFAISFTKGCYLGQETVARIDALGHVNRLLRVLRFETSEPVTSGTELVMDGRTVAKITSVDSSEWATAPFALGYVRRGLEKPGTRLNTQLGPAEIFQFPPA